MKCPKCGTWSKVKDSRPKFGRPDGNDHTYRRRECNECGHRFDTYECYEMADPELAMTVRDDVLPLLKRAIAHINIPQ